VGVVSIEEVMDLAMCRHVDFPGIGKVNLDTPELPSNDREILKVVTERMFAKPSILETIASVTLAQRQYKGVGGSAPPAVPEAAEAAAEESAAGMESVVVVSAPSPTREGQEASLPQSAEAVASVATATAADATEGVVREVGPSSPYPVAAVVVEVPVLREPAASHRERVASEGQDGNGAGRGSALRPRPNPRTWIPAPTPSCLSGQKLAPSPTLSGP
jgi:hypothetical protein